MVTRTTLIMEQKMSRTYLISDTHLGHKNILKYEPIRKFQDIDEHDNYIIENLKATIKPEDVLIHHGDVAFNKIILERFKEIPGKKHLIMGNHDKFGARHYLEIFDEVHSMMILDNYLLTHIPIDFEERRHWKGNIHGHTHGRVKDFPWYYCVSVEQTNLKPVLFEDIKLNWYKDTGSELK